MTVEGVLLGKGGGQMLSVASDLSFRLAIVESIQELNLVEDTNSSWTRTR